MAFAVPIPPAAGIIGGRNRRRAIRITRQTALRSDIRAKNQPSLSGAFCKEMIGAGLPFASHPPAGGQFTLTSDS
jgi:hypothetical protein